jgi:hypothetical protein
MPAGISYRHPINEIEVIHRYLRFIHLRLVYGNDKRFYNILCKRQGFRVKISEYLGYARYVVFLFPSEHNVVGRCAEPDAHFI